MFTYVQIGAGANLHSSDLTSALLFLWIIFMMCILPFKVIVVLWCNQSVQPVLYYLSMADHSAAISQAKHMIMHYWLFIKDAFPLNLLSSFYRWSLLKNLTKQSIIILSSLLPSFVKPKEHHPESFCKFHFKPKFKKGTYVTVNFLSSFSFAPLNK